MFKKLNFLYIIVFICIVSCSPQRRLSNLLTRYPDLIDTTRTTTVTYRDTVIFVPVLGTDTVYKYGHITDTVRVSSGTAHAVTYIVRDTLKLFVVQSDTILEFRLDSVIRESQIKDVTIMQITHKCDKSKFEGVLDKVLYIVLAIGFIFLIRFIYKILK